MKQKLKKLKDRILYCIENGLYFDTIHAVKRSIERQINRAEVLYVLKTGAHEKNKDKYDKTHSAWNYAIRGKTIDETEIRVIISFDRSYLIIITVIKL